jgi:hypothetical protein
VAERLHGILKTEYEIVDGCVGEKDAKRKIKLVYNTDRPHMSCHGLTPVAAHRVGNYNLKKDRENLYLRGCPWKQIRLIFKIELLT